MLLKDLYEQTAHIWRPDMESQMGLMMLSQLLFAAEVAFFYPIGGLGAESSKKVLPFAIGLGLVIATPQIASYCYLPIPMTLSLSWVFSELFKAFGAVLIVSKIYNWKQS